MRKQGENVMGKKLISIVVPCYNEEEAIPIFVKETEKTIEFMKQKYDLEFEYECFVIISSEDKHGAEGENCPLQKKY